MSACGCYATEDRIGGPEIVFCSLHAAAADMRDVLCEVSILLDDYSDVVDGADGEPRPNRAMSLLHEVDQVLERVTR